MYLIKNRNRVRPVKGEMTATLAVVAMMVMTFGVLLGTSLVRQGTPQTQTEALVNGNLAPIGNDHAAISNIGRPVPRDINPEHEFVQVDLCFNGNPPSNGRYKLAVYTTNDSSFQSWHADNVIGSAVERRVTNPASLRCGNGSERMGLVYDKSPDRPTGGGTGSGTGGSSGSTPNTPTPSPSTVPSITPSTTPSAAPTPTTRPPCRGICPPVEPTSGSESSFNFFGEFQGAVIVLETQNMGFTDVVVGKILKEQFDPPSGGGGTGGGPAATATPIPATPTPSLPAADRCFTGCTTAITSFEAGDCGAGFTCKVPGAGGGGADPHGNNNCATTPNNCKCIPDDKPTATTFDAACSGRAMCNARAVIGGTLNITGDIPQDSSGNKYWFKVLLCKQTVTSGGKTRCTGSVDAPADYAAVLVNPSSLAYEFRGLPLSVPLKKMGVYLDPNMYKADGTPAGVPVPNYAGVRVTCPPGSTGGIEREVDSTTPDANRRCYILIKNESSPATPSCTASGVNFSATLPAFTPTPIPTATTAPTATPVPSEDDRTLTIKIEVMNHTKCNPSGQCDPNSSGTTLTGTWEAQICSYQGSTELECKDMKSDEFNGLGAGDGNDPRDSHHVILEDTQYILPPGANKIKFKDCELDLEGEENIDCPTPFGVAKSISLDRNGAPSDDVVKYSIDVRQGSDGPQLLGSVKTDTDASDISGNSCVNVDDYSKLIIAYGKTTDELAPAPQFDGGGLHTTSPEDINEDGVVNAFDMAILLTNLNQGDNCAFNL